MGTPILHPVFSRWQCQLDDGRVQCNLCPCECKLKDGQQGLCAVRGNRGGEIVPTAHRQASVPDYASAPAARCSRKSAPASARVMRSDIVDR